MAIDPALQRRLDAAKRRRQQRGQHARSRGGGGSSSSSSSSGPGHYVVPDGNGLVSIPGGGRMSVAALAERGVPGYRRNMDGSYSVPTDATFTDPYSGESRIPVSQYQWARGVSGRPGEPQGGGSTPGSPPSPEEQAAAGDRELSQTDARESLRALARALGLPPSLADRAYNEVIKKTGSVSQDRLYLWLIEQPEYKDRFRGIVAQREAAARGENVRVMSEREYMDYEETTIRLENFYGVPKGMLSSAKQVAKLTGELFLSSQELEARIISGWGEVAKAPPEVRAAYGELFGIQGDAQLLADILDDETSQADIEKRFRQASAFGLSGLAGAGLTAAGALRAGELATSPAQVAQGIEQIARARALFDESVSEQVDFTADVEGVNAAFAGNDAALRRRLDERVAAVSGGGGALLTEGGLAAGTAD